MTTAISDDILTLTATMAPGKKCNGHMDEIPFGAAYEDQHGYLWCLACAKHLVTCTDEDCDHPAAVFDEPDASALDPKEPHRFDRDDDQPSYAPDGGYCRCGWAEYARVHAAAMSGQEAGL